jgi:hypothetical protein
MDGTIGSDAGDCSGSECTLAKASSEDWASSLFPFLPLRIAAADASHLKNARMKVEKMTTFVAQFTLAVTSSG